MANDRDVGDRNAPCGVICTAREFADVDFQRRVWINGDGPEVSSYIEAVMTIFDDYHVEDFANGDALRFGLSSSAFEKLKSFVTTLDSFDKGLQKDLYDAEITALPNWRAVVASAAEFLDCATGWLESNCRDFTMFGWSWSGKFFGEQRRDDSAEAR